MGDVNGDGFDDLIYTARSFASGYPTVWILFGGSTFDDTPDVELTYNPPYNGNFGYAIWSDDLNRDGYDDIIVSNPVEFGTLEENYEEKSPKNRAGREVFIYFGASNISGLRYPDITIQCPGHIINDYEFGLDLCTIRFYFDEPSGYPDAYPDIVIGCPHKVGIDLPGKVFIFRGPNFTERRELISPRTGDRLGFSVTSADYNRDEIDELVAGGYAENGERGMFVVWDAYKTMMCCFDNPPVGAGARFGWDVSSGDVTNDGYPDLIVSSYRSYPPKVFISYGHEHWRYVNVVLNQSLTGLHSIYDFFGICLTYCGDINKDGIGDVVIGACQNGYVGVGNGYAALYFGGDSVIDPTPDFVVYGEAYDDGLGYEVNVKAGDINGDGYDDFAVSAPFNDTGGRDAGRIYLYGELNLLSSDPNALAFNGNRHLARKIGTEEFFLVYTDNGRVLYTNSTNGGVTWDYSPFEVGEGSYPAIALSSNGLPSVCWTDDAGGLWYRRQTAFNVWGPTYHLYDPWNIWQPRLNSPPSVVITPSAQGDSVHILATLHIPANGPQNWVVEYSFQIDQPMQGSFTYIEGGTGSQAGAIRYNPSIARCEVNNSLHAVWQRADTICYATREVGQPWNNWGWQFDVAGLQSAHPFVECYGDMVYVVWQHKATPSAREEVYKGWRQIPNNFSWTNFSRTPDTKSLFPVSASGFFTVYVDEIIPYPNCGWEIFYKVRPDDIAYNISQTSARSTYPQSVCRFTAANFYLYTAWLDGDNIPYEIRFKKLGYIPTAVLYFTSTNGYETPSLYLVARDSFISNWQVPVDIGYETITYQFPLEPGYRYKIKVVAYHEGSGEWQDETLNQV